jgi:hypothetical protein
VMFREGLAPGARHAMAAVNPNGDAALVARTSVDGASVSKPAVSSYGAMWAKLTRAGSRFEAYQSRDGIAWVQIGAVEIALPRTVWAGLAITSHQAGTLATANVDHFSLSERWNPGAPAEPTSLQSILISAAETEHRWTDSATTVTTEIERSADGVNFSVVGTVPAGTQYFADRSVGRGMTYSYRLRARNEHGLSLASNTTTLSTPTLSAAARAPLALQPPNIAADVSTTASFTVTGASASASYQWQRNGGATGPAASSIVIGQVNVAETGIYTARVTDGGATTLVHGILGIRTTAKVVGSAEEVGTDIKHPNGNLYDQMLLRGSAATVTADPGQVTRVSLVDLGGDIVQIEFSGAGTMSVCLDNATGPVAAANYNQPGVTYMQGHPSIVITGANETTNVGVFSVGRANAVNQAIFRDISYEGTAGLGFIAISSANGKFGGIYAGNATFFQSRGPTGIYAPGVEFTGPIYLNDIIAGSDALPMLMTGGAADVRVTGGDMQQVNVRPIQVSGITQLRFTSGSTSHGAVLPMQTNRGVFEEDGSDVTARIVVQQP